VFTAIKQARSPSFKGGRNETFDAHNNGVGVGKWSKQVPASIRSAVAKQFAALKAGHVKGIPTSVK
jgi:basic membrane lipoprotein Med (substrate-binding protein (PBP1-ABC) superfamily)